jgi:hypothetical protein
MRMQGPAVEIRQTSFGWEADIKPDGLAEIYESGRTDTEVIGQVMIGFSSILGFNVIINGSAGLEGRDVWLTRISNGRFWRASLDRRGITCAVHQEGVVALGELGRKYGKQIGLRLQFEN